MSAITFRYGSLAMDALGELLADLGAPIVVGVPDQPPAAVVDTKTDIACACHNVGAALEKGRRNYMEDSCATGRWCSGGTAAGGEWHAALMLDGHGGDGAAKRVGRELLDRVAACLASVQPSVALGQHRHQVPGESAAAAQQEAAEPIAASPTAKALARAFWSMQRALEGEPQRGFADAGTTATLALWDPLGECLWCAWVGDTCALIVDLDDGTTQRLTAYEHRVEHVVSLSGSSTEDDTAEDDAPTAGGAVGAGDSERSSTRGANDSHFTAQAKSEQQRLARLGARYWCDRLLSPLGADDTIMLTRALGDRAFYAMDKQLMRERQPPYSSATLDHIRLTGDVRLPERYLVTPTPHVALCGLAAGRRYGLVLATDGVSDYVSDERLAELVLANAADPQAAAEAVVHEAKTARSRDNMSALVVVDLRQAWPACSGCQDRPQ